MGMEIVSVADLKIGMFVVEPDCPWTDLPFALQGFVISTPKQIEIFQGKCRFVHVDFSRSLNEYFREARHERDRPLRAAPPAAAAPESGPGQRRGRGPFSLVTVDEGLRARRQRFLGFLQRQDGSEHARELSSEMAFIEPRFDDFQHSLHDTFKQVEAEQSVDLRQVREGLHDMAGSLKRNPDALTWLLHLRRVDQYSFDHAVDVAVYLLMLGSHVGWRGQNLIELGLAGLLQDVGKAQLPHALLAKTTPLSAEEQALVHSHVASSLEILVAYAHLPSEVLVIVSRHHERWDGSGYPRGLAGKQIGPGGEMAGLVDSFCAMLKHKPYRDAVGHQGALEDLYKQRDRQFSPALLEQFVQCVGLYPIGTLLELDSGEIGVVIQQNRVQRSRPRILLLLNREKQNVPGYKVLDLRDRACQGLRVARTLPLNAYGLTSDDYYLR